MTKDGRQVFTTIGIATLVAALLVGLAWVSMADLVLGVLCALLGLAVGGYLGYRCGHHQAEQARRARRRRVPARGPAKRTAK